MATGRTIYLSFKEMEMIVNELSCIKNCGYFDEEEDEKTVQRIIDKLTLKKGDQFRKRRI